MRCISVDLEVNKRNERIFALAAVDEASGDTLILPKERLRSLGLKAALAQLDEFVPENASLVGHNLIAFDIELLESESKSLASFSKWHLVHAKALSIFLSISGTLLQNSTFHRPDF